MQQLNRRAAAICIVAALLLVSVVSGSLAILGTVFAKPPAPVSTPTAIGDTCSGELVGLGETTFLANDNRGNPIRLVVRKSTTAAEVYGELVGLFYDEKTGLTFEVGASVSVIREETELEWRGVAVIVRECIPGLVYRYELLSKPDNPTN